MEHVRLIDSLRGVAAGLVLISHVAFWTGAANIDLVGGFLARGDSGVAIFFAISAFLLLSPAYAMALSEPEPPKRSWSSYFARRAARILPAYWLAFAGVLTVGWLATTPDGLGSLRKIVIHLFLGQALFVEQYQGFSQTWSLTTEVTFYLLVPLLSLSIIRSLRKRRDNTFSFAATVIFTVALIGPATQVVALLLSQSGYERLSAALAMSALGHATWFCAGAFIALALQAQSHGLIEAENSLVARATHAILAHSRSTLLLCGIAAYAVASTSLAGPRDLSQPHVSEVIVKETLYALVALFFLLAATKPIKPDTLLDSFASSDLNRWIGDTSYGVFLWHLVVIQGLFLFTNATLFNAHFAWTLQLVLTITLVLASLSWFVVEKPILSWVRKRTTSARDRAR